MKFSDNNIVLKSTECEPMEWKNRWNAHRTTIPGLINMDAEGVSTQMMEIMHGSLYSKIQDHMMHEDGLELNLRVK
eukprot:Pgem_evm1s3299